MSKIVSIRIEEDKKAEIQKRASQEGKTLSEYCSGILSSHIDGETRIDLIVQKMQEDLFQVQGMLGIMQAFNSSVYELLLGRTTPMNFTEEEVKIAKQNKLASRAMLAALLSKSAKKIIDGENVWGSIPTDDKASANS